MYVADLERENERMRNLLSTSGIEDAPPNAPQTSFGSPSAYSDEDSDEGQPSSLDTMIATTAQLFIDTRGKYRYQGHSAGFTLLGYVQDRINNLLKESSGNDGWEPFDVWKAFDRPTPINKILHANEHYDLLPSREVAQVLTDIALDDGCCLMSFVHRPTFSRLLNKVYDNDFHSAEASEFLPVLYEALALGTLFTVERETDQANRNAIEFQR